MSNLVKTETEPMALNFAPDWDENTPIIQEFLTQNEHGDNKLLKGLNLMLTTFFKHCRYIDDDAEAVQEANYFCNYLIANKSQLLFNPKNVA